MDAQTTITDEALAGSIASAFEDCFASFDTVLVGGAEEPLYRPSQGDEPAKLGRFITLRWSVKGFLGTTHQNRVKGRETVLKRAGDRPRQCLISDGRLGIHSR